MIKIIKDAIANIMFNKLMNNFDDIEALSSIQTSSEFKLLKEMENIINDYAGNEYYSVDYDLVVETWNKLYNSIKEANKEYSQLIDAMKIKFDLIVTDDFLLIGTLFNHEKYITKNIEEKYKKDFNEYIVRANQIILQYKEDLLSYHMADLQDRFFDDIDIIDSDNIKYRKISLFKPSVYIDQNSVAEIIGDQKYKKYFTQASKKNKFAFLYSSYLIEDSINMNPIFLKGFLDELSKLTNNQMVGYLTDGINFITEDPKDTINRVKKYHKLTKFFEQTRFIDVVKHYHMYPELRKGKSLNNEIMKDVAAFFKSTSKSECLGYSQVKNKFSTNDYIAKFIKDGSLEMSATSDIRETISSLSELFDFINFETEKVCFSNKSKIYSSYRDRQHLEHAYLCDFFITNDNKLKNRGKAIYSFIGASTKTLTVKEFFNDHLVINNAESLV